MALSQDQLDVIRACSRDDDAYDKLLALIDDLNRDNQATEQRYRQMFERNNAIKLLIDPDDGRIVDANPAAVAYYGYPPDVLCTLSISDINILTKDEIHTEMQHARSESRSFFEFRHRLASGEIREVEVYSGPVDLPDKRYLFSIILDVSDRRLLQTALRDSEERFRSIIEQSDDGIVLVDESGRVAVWNRAQHHLTGVAPVEALGSYIWDLQMSMAAEPGRLKLENLRQTVRRALHNQQASWFHEPMEMTIRRRSGETRIIQSTAFPIQTADGFMIGSISRNITELRRVMERERHLLQKALEQEQAISALKHRMMVRIAHEFRTPLTVILTSAQMIDHYLDRMDLNQRRKRFQNIESQVSHMVNLLDDLHFLVESQPFNPVPYDLQALCRTVRDGFAEPDRIHIDISPDLRTVYGDPRLVRIILDNLLDNALKFSEGPVGLTVVAHRNLIEMRVVDEGIGILPDERNIIFDPFTRGSNFDELPGLGLGLTKAEQAVALHTGTLQLDSTPGSGTCIAVWLPR